MESPENSRMSNAAQPPMFATDIPPRRKPSNYPAPLAQHVSGRQKRQLGDVFGLTHFGVNLTSLAPGAQSALLHRHTHQDEFVYVLIGSPTLRTDEGEVLLAPGMCVGFPANGQAHHLINRTAEDVQYLEVGNRCNDDRGEYPEDDLVARYSDGGWTFARKDGSAW
jgi:uncharacterized cupin superfamily protein